MQKQKAFAKAALLSIIGGTIASAVVAAIGGFTDFRGPFLAMTAGVIIATLTSLSYAEQVKTLQDVHGLWWLGVLCSFIVAGLWLRVTLAQAGGIPVACLIGAGMVTHSVMLLVAFLLNEEEPTQPDTRDDHAAWRRDGTSEYGAWRR